MGITALSIRDELIPDTADHLCASGLSATKRVPRKGDVADLYIDCSDGTNSVRICFQPNPRINGWHVITFPRIESRALFQAVREQLILYGVLDRWPDIAEPGAAAGCASG